MLSTLPESITQQAASGLMTTETVCIQTSDTVVETLKRFNRERHSFYPLIDSESQKLLGVIARDQFYDYVQLNGLKESACLDSVEYTHLPTERPEALVEQCLETMIRGGSNKLLITDENGQLHGILSIRDVLAQAVQDKVPEAEVEAE